MTDDRDVTERASYEATGNPLYVWQAIGRYAAGEPLPLWIRRYLLQATRELIRLQIDHTISPSKAAQRTAQALGIVSQGRNRFADSRRDRENSFVATLYGLGPGKGESEEWALTLADATGIRPDADQANRVRSILRRVAKARRLWPGD
jgi:hypothetical protein